MSLGVPVDLTSAHIQLSLVCALGDSSGCERRDVLSDAVSDEDLVDAAIVDAVARDLEGAVCGKFYEKVLAKATADISEAQRRARICMVSNYQDCD